MRKLLASRYESEEMVSVRSVCYWLCPTEKVHPSNALAEVVSRYSSSRHVRIGLKPVRVCG